MSVDIKTAKEKLKSLLKNKALKGIQGVGIIDLDDDKSVLVVNMLKKSFNKNVKQIPPDVDGIKVETRIVAKAVLQNFHKF